MGKTNREVDIRGEQYDQRTRLDDYLAAISPDENAEEIDPSKDEMLDVPERGAVEEVETEPEPEPGPKAA